MDIFGIERPATALIVAGGDPVDVALLDRIPGPTYVIAADSGLDHAAELGLTVDLVIGDLDSVTPQALQRARALGTEIETRPTDKDATDLELALDHAMSAGCTRSILFGGYGGRLSHLLGNALVLTAAKLAPMSIEWHVGEATVYVVRPETPLELVGLPGDLASLLAAGGPAEGVTTSDLRWHLDNATLHPGSTHGMSNEMTGRSAQISLRRGVLLAVHERTSR